MKLFEIAKPKVDLAQFDVETKYDWFYNYVMLDDASAFGSNYKNWKEKNPNGHPKLFIETFRFTNKNASTYKGKLDYFDKLEQDLVKFGSDGVSFDGELYFDNVNTPGLKEHTPSFNFAFVGAFSIAQCKIKSIDDIPKWAPPKSIAFDLSYNSFKSISGIHKRITHCKILFLVGNPIKEGGLLGLLMIKGIEKLNYSPQYLSQPAADAMNIARKYIKAGKLGSRAVIEAQSEMLDAGLEEFATL